MAGYLGNAPSAVPLTSADITDGIITSAKIADSTIALADLSATGTKDSTTFLRGDNTFATAGATAGQVIQVVTATDSTERSTTSTSFVTASNTLSVSITPASTSNKILIIASFNSRASSGGNYALTLFRGATDLGNGTYGMARMTQYSGVANIYTRPCLSILDSPSTTSSTTYQVYIKSESGDSAFLNMDSTKGSITALEIKG